MRPGELELEKVLVLEGTPERVFRAFTEPTELARWWGPRGFTTPSVELDLWIGGRYRLEMKPPEGPSFHLEGEFRDVHPPDRLSYTFNWDPPDAEDRETLVTLTFREVDGGTELRMRQQGFATEARRALHDAGWSDSIDRLRDHLSSPTS